jgi:hypothetical protein
VVAVSFDDASLAAASSGCGCQTPGSKSNNGGLLAAIAMLGGLAAMALRRRRARHGATLAGIATIGAMASTMPGCACGDSNASGSSGCGSDCNQECQPALPLGLAGAYLSVAKASDGTYWVSGYNDSALSDGVSQLYGDLVVGKYDQGKGAVMWQSVDGLPPPRTDGTCPDNDPAGWRHGETDAADDVGLWTSIQIGDSNRPMVSYYDATHGAIKFAVLDNGTWTTHFVKQAAGSDSGRYSKLLIVDGKPVIVFLTIEAGMANKGRARVTVARSSDPAPKDPSVWAFEDAVVDDGEPCNGITCGDSNVCVKSSGVCQATVPGCSPACTGSQQCVTVMNAASCQDTITKDTPITYPNVFGDYISAQNGPNGIGIVAYDRIHGNLVALESKGSGSWKQTILDGETGSRTNNTAKDTGDCGIGASLFIAGDGTWHVSYVSGDDETVRYVSYKSGAAPSKPETVDDGMSVDGMPFTDGKHIVGDDSFIQVDGSGTVTVVYQDATAGTLRRATGTSGSTGHKWTTHKLDQSGKFAGFFPASVDTFVANYWRQLDRDTKDTHGDVAFVTP